jgi:hypothetical protein
MHRCFLIAAPQTFALRNSSESPVAVAPTSQFTVGKYPFADTAEKVLEQFGDKKLMH